MSSPTMSHTFFFLPPPALRVICQMALLIYKKCFDSGKKKLLKKLTFYQLFHWKPNYFHLFPSSFFQSKFYATFPYIYNTFRRLITSFYQNLNFLSEFRMGNKMNETMMSILFFLSHPPLQCVIG